VSDRRFQRYVDALTDEEALTLHRIVCRRAAAIYEPMYRAKRDQNWRAGMAANQGPRFGS
jgi:hypothetical protein